MPRFPRRIQTNYTLTDSITRNFHNTQLFSYLHSFFFLTSSTHSQRKKIKENSKWPCKCRPPQFTLQDYPLLPLLPSDHSPIHLLSRLLSSLVPLTSYFILINNFLFMDLPGLLCVLLPNKPISVVTAGSFLSSLILSLILYMNE